MTVNFYKVMNDSSDLILDKETRNASCATGPTSGPALGVGKLGSHLGPLISFICLVLLLFYFIFV